MPGIKGQKWSSEKRKPEKHKCNVSVSDRVYKKICKIADKKQWSKSKVIENILEEKLR